MYYKRLLVNLDFSGLLLRCWDALVENLLWHWAQRTSKASSYMTQDGSSKKS